MATVGHMYDSVEHLPAADHPELLAATVAGRVAELPSAVVFSIGPEIADTERSVKAQRPAPTASSSGGSVVTSKSMLHAWFWRRPGSTSTKSCAKSSTSVKHPSRR
ncbi:hypothetical protein JCM18920_994 [Cutibacterium acnes JCM 18920]|nr:hypothetical protein JCM18920_994 [Cutibacterium acnes JCM 18920]